MTFGLTGWLKSKYPNIDFEIPVWFPSREQADHREWLITNGLGGFSSGTVSTAQTRRYHGLLISSLAPPDDRHHILTKLDEIVTVNGKEFSLATNHWASGVVSPTGYKLIEAFTTMPVPTWVYELDGHYLVKQISLKWGTNELYAGYWWLPDYQQSQAKASIQVRVLTNFRKFHGSVRGTSDDRFPQCVAEHQSTIILGESKSRLCLSWNQGQYQAEQQWWWDYHFPEETLRGLPDKEDLFLVGSLRADLPAEEVFSLGASLDTPIEEPCLFSAVESVLERQKSLLRQAALPNNAKSQMLVVACDQFLVSELPDLPGETAVIEGYPWFNECGRTALISLPGLTLATRRYDQARQIMNHLSRQLVNGFLPNRLIEDDQDSTRPVLKYGAADVTLWWAWALYKYFQQTKDKEFVGKQLPLLLEAAGHYIRGTTHGVTIDSKDGLLKTIGSRHEYSWMDSSVADIPITPRSGKAVELNALWHNLLQSVLSLAESISFEHESLPSLKNLAEQSKQSMQKFWNKEESCLFDIVEAASSPQRAPDATIRPNQLLAIALPFRTLQPAQERAVLAKIESDMLTPMGIRSLGASDPGYQGMFGCGLAHADQYHRDLSYHQGTAWPWLLGFYCDALVNVFGLNPETTSRVSIVLQPLLEHMQDEGCLGSISEIFDGTRPHLARGATASAWSAGEVMRWYSWQIRR
ncbi:MAG TPA: amylo-alpha-1,6-glucosidase [Oculatellaceae cyanobacterium]